MRDYLARLATSVSQASASIICLNSQNATGQDDLVVSSLSRRDVSLSTMIETLSVGHAPFSVADLRTDARFASDSLVAGHHQFRFLAYTPIGQAGVGPTGFICVLGKEARPPLTSGEAASLQQIAELVLADHRRERRHAHLMHVSNQALRADRILQLVNEAETCAEGLISLLEELCRFHDAALGRMWELTERDQRIREIGRFNARPSDVGIAHDAVLPTGEVTPDVVRAIEDNQPCAGPVVDTSARRHANAGSSGLSSQVTVPIWLKEQRFAISLAFTTERTDLHAVMADITGLAGSISPALFRKYTEEQIRFVAHHDELTRLSNRLSFQECLRQASSLPLSLLYLDLDGFKAVNDTHGHEAGDRLLRMVADRLLRTVSERDVVARIGGDEFAILQAAPVRPGEPQELARLLIQAMSLPFEIDGEEVRIGLSVGIATTQEPGASPDAVLRQADLALYQSKEGGRNTYRTFDPAADMRQRQRGLVKRDFEAAMAEAQFSLAYQPICDADSRHVREFEALLRWTHPTRGLIDPGEFIPLAEKTGMIVPIGWQVLETACREAVRWPDSIGIAVNFSPTQFRQPDMPSRVADVLQKTGLEPGRLNLEVTEGLLLDESNIVLDNLRALREQGVRTTLDDFGVAYAGLSYLRRFSFDRLKIDKSFTQNIVRDETALAIIEAILALCKRLGLSVVAEGVETEDQMQRLQRVGCKLVQGFLIGCPSNDVDARRYAVQHEVRP